MSLFLYKILFKILQIGKSGIPVSEGRTSSEKNSFGFGLGLVKHPEKGVMFHAVLPKDLTLVSTGHHEFKSVLMGALNTKIIKTARE